MFLRAWSGQRRGGGIACESAVGMWMCVGCVMSVRVGVVDASVNTAIEYTDELE